MNKLAPLLAILALVACKNDERTKKKAEPKGKAVEALTTGSAKADPTKDRSGSTAPNIDTSKLWAHAPKDSVFGIVFGDGTFEKSFDAGMELKRIIGTVPKGKEAIKELEREMKGAPFNVLDKSQYAPNGLAFEKGAAVFVDSKENVVAIFPVGDRDAFTKLVEAKKETVGGREFDRIDEAYCLQEQAVYVCAEDIKLIDDALSRPGGQLASRVKELPIELRGDVELVALLDKIPDAQRELGDLAPAITNVKTAVLSARMDRGKIAVRGWLEGTPPPPVAAGLEALPFAKPLREVGGGAVSALSMRVPLEAIGALKQVPPSLPLAGFDFRTGLVDQLTGEFALYTAGSKSAIGFTTTLAVGMKDTKVLAESMEKLCPMGNVVPGLTIKAEKGRCSADFDPSKLPDPQAKNIFNGTIPSVLTAKDQMLVLSVGGEPVMGDVTQQAGSATTRSILKNKWNLLAWGRFGDPLGTDKGLIKTLTSEMGKNAPPETKEFLELFRVVVGHLYEVGFAFKLDSKGAHVVADITTMAADPKEVYEAYSKTVAAGILSGKPYAETLSALGDKHPNTLTARQAQLLAEAAPSLAFGIGAGAAIMIPAFVKYAAKSKAAKQVELKQAKEAIGGPMQQIEKR